nr:hypothetical protein [uncultured Sphingobacterium sp.]
MEINRFELMDRIGKALFFKLFTKTKATESDDEYSKYDLLIKGDEGNKYIELKCLTNALPDTLTHLITLTDFEYLTNEIEENDKSLYVLFDDNLTVVYDLKAVKETGSYEVMKRKNYLTEMNRDKYESRDYAVIDYKKSLDAGAVKCYLKNGSKKHYDFKISNLLKKMANDTITDTELEEIYNKIKLI